MTPERFGELLRRPQLLGGQNATELEELIAAYPWCGPLRVLRYRKAVLDEAPDLDLWRSRAEPFLLNAVVHAEEQRLLGGGATRAEAHFAFDPDHGGSEAKPDTTLSSGAVDLKLGEATVALTPATEVLEDKASEPMPIAAESEFADTPTPSEGLEIVHAPESPSPEGASSDFGPAVAKAYEPLERPTEGFDLHDCILRIAAAVKTADWYLHRNGLIMEYGRPKPAPIEHLESYRTWKQRRARTSWDELLRLGIEAPKLDKRSVSARHKPEVIEPEVASETLADLLAAQGHTDKAVRMYEQLSLRYPAKNASFASRILALQQQEA